MRIGILGGTFNPPHIGHIYAADEVRKALNLDKILFIPNNIPPHKQMPKGSASTSQRLEMLKIMLKDYVWAEVSDIEIKRGGASYTVDTLSELKKNKEYEEIFFIMGTDMFLSFDENWKEPEKICSLCSIAVIAREKNQKEIILQKEKFLKDKYDVKIEVVSFKALEVSSTEIRNGEKKMIPKEIDSYIRKNRLYLTLD